ncbi:sigma-70 family RNA polymerase sigma factor [Oceanobacillus damuensis]|uniref:sigma-70 family RNA polymerase sigma factor n=1 Tax=Oceanobacillus damuensis TaxID=937928 RepID=UPI00082B6321|nr:sigma-70 family RNA polymerase sigma factor [Oceanobacillus damuensis]
MDKKKVTFEEIFEHNERRIHFYMRKLNIRDPHDEFYQEGIVAMWNAYENYQPDKGTLATYFNYTIRNRMIDLMRKQNREQEKEELCVRRSSAQLYDGNLFQSAGAAYPIIKAESFQIPDRDFWQNVKDELSDKQWKWVKFHIMEGMSADAVKSWGKEARRKLKKADFWEGGVD